MIPFPLLKYCLYCLPNSNLLLPLVECEWGEWEERECSVSCGGGLRQNYRPKLVQELFTICEGNGSFIEECNSQKCPGSKFIYLIVMFTSKCKCM